MNRITTNWKIAGTLSYRLSSKKLFRKYGANLQNKDNILRHCFIADDGKELCQTDQAGAEALILAYLCPPDSNYRKLILHGVKHHIFTAMHLFANYWTAKLGINDFSIYLKSDVSELKNTPNWGVLAKEIKNHEVYYYIGKKAGLSFNYGLMPKNFAKAVLLETGAKIRLSVDESTRVYSTYHSIFPEIRRWHCEVIDTLSKQGQILRNLQRYPIHLTSGVWNDDLFKRAYASIPQSTVGTITNLAFTRLQKMIDGNASEIRGYDANLLQNGHDSILSQCAIGAGMEWSKIVKNEIEQELENFHGEKFKMKSESGIGRNWGKYNEQTNPNGIKEILL